jgi:uroporphyrinogen decarboxylase
MELQNDRLLRAARQEPVDCVPVWLMRQAGRYLPEFRELREKYDFFTLCQTPDLAAQITLQPVQRFNVDAAIIFSDILVVPQAMGLQVTMESGTGPVFPQPLRTPDEIGTRLEKNVNVQHKLAYVFEAIKLANKLLNGKVPLIGFSGAPWTLMAYMIEGGGSKSFSTAKSWLYCLPRESHVLLERITTVIIDYLVKQIEAGAHVIQLFESWAGELGPAQFNEFCLPYLVKIAKEIKSRFPSIPFILFPKGAHYALSNLIASQVFDVLSLDWLVIPREVRRLCGNSTKVTLQGNLDPCALFAPPEKIVALTREMIHGFGCHAYIANLGHGCLPNYNPDHVAAFVHAVHNISKEFIQTQTE